MKEWGGVRQHSRKIENSMASEMQFPSILKEFGQEKNIGIKSIVFCKFSCSVISLHLKLPSAFYPDLNGSSNDWGGEGNNPPP